MATLTIRNVPEAVVEQLRRSAAANGRSMEQELRELLEARYASKEAALARIRARWHRMKPASARQVRGWVKGGRP